MLAGSQIANDDWPILDLVLDAIGPNRSKVFGLVRELTGWTATDTLKAVRSLPIRLTGGPMMTVRPTHELFLAMGATTKLVIQDGG